MDIHILEKGSDGQQRLVFHFPVPLGNNQVPVGAGGTITWREALVAYLGGSPVSVLPSGDGNKGTILSAEATNISAGAVMERTYSFPLDSGGTSDGQRVVSARAFYKQKKAEVTAEIVESLGYYGATLKES